MAGAIGVSASPRQVGIAVAASVLGWSLDLFSLYTILYVTPTLAELFFPLSNPTLGLASVYAAFGASFLMRPIGSAIFGAYADRHGRKKAMIAGTIAVGIVTALMGALPTIEQAGLFAPLALLLLRMAQGVFIGGIVASSHTIGTETVGQRWRGMLSGLTGAGGAGFATLFASLLLYLVSSLFPGEAFKAWGWRVMFFSGIVSTLFGLVLMRILEESPLWLAASRTPKRVKAPLRTVLSKGYRSTVLVNLMIVAGGAISYYLTSGYLPTFLEVVNRMHKPATGAILIAASAVVPIVAVLFGHLSESIGRQWTFRFVGGANLVLIPFAYTRLSQSTSVEEAAFFAIVLASLGNAIYAPTLIFLNERFPTAIRATGTALCWNVGFAIGGVMPTVVTAVSPGVSDIPDRLVASLIVATLLVLIGSMLSPETRGRLEG